MFYFVVKIKDIIDDFYNSFVFLTFEECLVLSKQNCDIFITI